MIYAVCYTIKSSKLYLYQRPNIEQTTALYTLAERVVCAVYSIGDGEKEKIRAAFQHWEKNTCVRFNEVSQNFGVYKNHISLTKSNPGSAKHCIL